MMRWWLYWVVSLVATLFTWLCAPVLVLFARDGFGHINNGTRDGIEPRLPWWLRPCGTDDNSLLGDAGHKLRWQGRSAYAQMVAWLWRNPAYVFERDVLGAVLLPGDVVTVVGNAAIKNRDNGIAGQYFCRVHGYWNWKWIRQITATRCLMIETGWKLQPYAQSLRVETAGAAQFVFSIRVTEFSSQ